MDRITVKEAAERLQITPQRVGQLIKAFLLPAKKHGRDWSIDPADLICVVNRPKVGRPKGKRGKAGILGREKELS